MPKPGPQPKYQRDIDGRYFTGIPCLRGHISKRYATGACIECQIAPEKREQKLNHYHNKLKNNPSWIADRPRRINVARKRLLPAPTRPEPILCECCGRPPHGKFKSLALDHDHPANIFRGWLCNGCNHAIGILGDNIEGIQRALDYLNGKITS